MQFIENYNKIRHIEKWKKIDIIWHKNKFIKESDA